MNKWIGSGRLTENPVIRYNGDKVSFVTFTVMCKRNRKIREGDQPVDFIDCICFGNIARLARDYLYKDKKVEVIGPLQSGHYTKDGKKVYTKTVLVEELQFAETKAEEKGTPGKPKSRAARTGAAGLWIYGYSGWHRSRIAVPVGGAKWKIV